MKIAILLHHIKINGGNRIAVSLATELEKLGHSVTFVSLKKSYRKFFFQKIKNIFSREKINWYPNFKGNLRYTYSFNEKLLKRYDVSIAVTAESARFLMDCKGIEDKNKFYYAMHDEKLYHCEKVIVEAVYRSNIKKIALSSWIKEIIENYNPKNVPVLIAPVDNKQFYPIEDLRKPDLINVLLLHHTYEWKGTKEGVEIVERLKRKYPQIRLIMYGVRANRPEEPHDEYHFNLPQEKLAELYSKTDIFLCPSWDEGLGMPGMEAMACKAALVTYDTGGSRDYAFDGETAFVAPHRDTTALEKRLEEAVLNEDVRKSIAENGYNFINSLPTWSEQAKKLELYLRNE